MDEVSLYIYQKRKMEKKKKGKGGGFRDPEQLEKPSHSRILGFIPAHKTGHGWHTPVTPTLAKQKRGWVSAGSGLKHVCGNDGYEAR